MSCRHRAEHGPAGDRALATGRRMGVTGGERPATARRGSAPGPERHVA
ncbi:hypothetical protein HW130_25045 [Streptomyces sp. PKU-EA00015]|nr:hypothetical protein [Streptomyces sp. PKU-EA00015]NWF29484.1 hypothetical protein [Streptomyces sp. PKU-EA00015]